MWVVDELHDTAIRGLDWIKLRSEMASDDHDVFDRFLCTSELLNGAGIVTARVLASDRPLRLMLLDDLGPETLFDRSGGRWIQELVPYYRESLDLLAPLLDGEVPDDPWSGKPFHYVRQEAGGRLGPAGGALDEDLEGQLQRHQVYVLR